MAKGKTVGFFRLVISFFCLALPGPLIAEEYGFISGTVYENDGISRLLRIEDNEVMLDDQVITATPASI